MQPKRPISPSGGSMKCLLGVSSSLLFAAVLAACSDGAVTGSDAQNSVYDRVFPNPTMPPPTLDDFNGDFAKFMANARNLRPEIEQRQLSLLEMRYDLSNRPSTSCKMSRGKPAQSGIRVKLP